MKFNRLLASATAAIALSLSVSATAPKYVFYFIGDGMGIGPVMATMNYLRTVHPEQKQLTMTSFPVASFAQTWSASSPVTDSAAAGTALSTGHKTKNGMLGMDADTVSVTSVARILKDNGWGIGVLTSVAPDDATPGAFYAHVPKRSMFYEIDIQAAKSGYDFLGGASLRGLTDKNGNATDVADVMAENGVTIVYGPEGAATIKDQSRVILLGNPDVNPNNNEIGYTIDSIPGALTLPLMTETCLTYLEKKSPDRFFMMVEGGNIDHALHANDGGTAVKEIINFDQAIDLAYQFYLAHPDETLIVVTADHDTGGLANGNRRLKYAANYQYIDSQRQSKEMLSEYCKAMLKSRRIFTWEDMKEYLSENLGLWKAIPVTESEEKNLQELFAKCFERRESTDEKTLYADFNEFAVEVIDIVNGNIGFGFTTTSHTGNPVPVFAVGVGAERFSNLNNNIDIPEKILDIIGLNK